MVRDDVSFWASSSGNEIERRRELTFALRCTAWIGSSVNSRVTCLNHPRGPWSVPHWIPWMMCLSHAGSRPWPRERSACSLELVSVAAEFHDRRQDVTRTFEVPLHSCVAQSPPSRSEEPGLIDT